MSVNDIREKAVPYYACLIAQILAQREAYTLDALISASHIPGSDGWESGPQFRLADKNIVQAALEFLDGQNIARYIPDDFGPDLILRAANFSENLKGLHREEDTVFYKFALASDARANWLNEALDVINSKISELVRQSSPDDSNTSEVDEDTWTPLPIERENNEFKAAIETSEKALEVIEQNNGYAASHPDERNGIVSTIRGTLDAVKSGNPSREAIVAGLLKPFRYIAGKFSDSVMGEFAKIAVAALIKWLI